VDGNVELGFSDQEPDVCATVGGTFASRQTMESSSGVREIETKSLPVTQSGTTDLGSSRQIE